MKTTTDVGAREMCALTVTARPIPREVAGRRSWPLHVGAALAAAMFAPIVTVVASGVMSARRPTPGTLRADAPGAVVASASKSAIIGRVVDAAGNPAPNASVRILTVDAMPSRALGVTTDTQGRFRVDGFGGRRVDVVVENDDGWVESGEIEPDGARTVVLVLGPASRLAGVVLDERGAPVPQAVVKSWGGSPATEKFVAADDEGRYVIERVAPDAGRVTVWARGFDPSTLVVDARGGRATTLDVRLRASPPIRGRVLGPTGRPVSGARVVACEEGAMEAAISNAAGGFELPATTVGCVVNAAHPRFASARTMTIASTGELAIRLGAGGAIEGIALDDRGAPVNSFSVTIESFDPAEGESQESSRAGESRDELRGLFRLDDLAAGTYVLRATTPEGLASESETVVVARGKVARAVALNFPKPPSVEPPTPEEPAEAAEP